MYKRKLAWILLKSRWRMMTTWGWYPQRIQQRDFIGSLLADWVALGKLAFIAVTGRYLGMTEIERRAIVCSRRRLEDRRGR